jgi:presenilin-like A22 family membrane protease
MPTSLGVVLYLMQKPERIFYVKNFACALIGVGIHALAIIVGPRMES